MSTSLARPDRVNISDKTVREAREVNVPPGTSLVMQDKDGNVIPLSPDVEDLLLTALASIARNGGVTISRIPKELTSNAAADILGVSRPTLLKWARDGVIQSHKVGTHTRFKRADVLRLQTVRAAERKQAFEDLRRLEWENRDVLGR